MSVFLALGLSVREEVWKEGRKSGEMGGAFEGREYGVVWWNVMCIYQSVFLFVCLCLVPIFFTVSFVVVVLGIFFDWRNNT